MLTKTRPSKKQVNGYLTAFNVLHSHFVRLFIMLHFRFCPLERTSR